MRDVGMLPGIGDDDGELLKQVEEARRRVIESLAGGGQRLDALRPLPSYRRQGRAVSSWKEYSDVTLEEFKKKKVMMGNKKIAGFPSEDDDISRLDTLSKRPSSHNYLEELIYRQEERLRNLALAQEDRMDEVLRKLQKLNETTRRLRNPVYYNYPISAPKKSFNAPSVYGYTPQSAQHSTHFNFDENRRENSEWEPDLSLVPRPRERRLHSPSVYGYTPQDAQNSPKKDEEETEVKAFKI